MNLETLNDQKNVEKNIFEKELEINNEKSIEELKEKIEEYLKDNVNNLEIQMNKDNEKISKINPLGKIIIEKSTFKDIDKISENLITNIEKIEKNIDIIKENTKELNKEKNFIQKGLETVYDVIKGTIIEKVVSNIIEKSKKFFGDIGKNTINLVKNVLGKNRIK